MPAGVDAKASFKTDLLTVAPPKKRAVPTLEKKIQAQAAA
jgi:HSP20 family molecular chaperone IbpA